MLIRFRLFLLLLSIWSGLRSQAQVPASLAADSSGQVAQPMSRGRAVLLRVGIPSVLVGVGVLAHSPLYNEMLWRAKEEMQHETQEVFGGFDAHGIDDYTRHVPLAIAYGMMASGHRGERTAVSFTLIYLMAHELDAAVVSNLKRITAEPRPYDANDLSSFPSSHTSQAFLTATLLHEQYGRQYPWLSVGGYAVATATGAMRLLGNKHWATDVLAGAGIGFLSAETVWHLYPVLTRLVPGHTARKLLLVPTYAPGGGAGVAMALSL